MCKCQRPAIVQVGGTCALVEPDRQFAGYMARVLLAMESVDNSSEAAKVNDEGTGGIKSIQDNRREHGQREGGLGFWIVATEGETF